MRRVLVILLLLIPSVAWAEDCHVPIRIDNLSERIIDGNKVYVVSADDVNITKTCFKPVENNEIIRAYMEEVARLTEITEEYRRNQDARSKLNHEQRDLIQRHEDTLDESIELANKYDKAIVEYKELVEDYDVLNDKFDKLIEKYRAVAMNSMSPFSLELGFGLTDDGDAIGIAGAGFNYYKTVDIKLFGAFHEDFNAFMGGASFRF